MLFKCPENGLTGNLARFPERSDVCPSDKEKEPCPRGPSYIMFNLLLK
jgi:hypothetical protein